MPGSKPKLRSWLEILAATVSGFLALLTAIWHDWLESFAFDPDHHNGSAEWLIVVVLAVICVAFSIAARLEWHRTEALV